MNDDDRNRADADGTEGSWNGEVDRTVPALCERCWFPILPGQTARRTPVHIEGPRFTARLVCFVHCSPVCTPQSDDPDDAEAA
jgi:hypothetical protein